MSETSEDVVMELNSKWATIPTITLDEQGDVTLIIGKEEQGVLVSSSILRRASPVWRVMFNDRWVESQATEIALPDDDPYAMLLVLQIAHLHFEEVPKKEELDVDNLFKLAEVCDKYDTVHLVRPFICLYNWIEDLRPLIPEEDESDHRGWLFIAWVFGCEDIFWPLIRNFLKTIWLNIEENYRDLGDRPLNLFMPPDIFENIISVREEVIGELIETCHSTLAELTLTHKCFHRTPQSKKSREWITPERDQCRATILGSFLQAVTDLGLFSHAPQPATMGARHLWRERTFTRSAVSQMRTTIPDASRFSMSIETFQGRLGKCVIHSYSQNHELCAARFNFEGLFQSIIDGMITMIPNNLPPAFEQYKVHMERQPKKKTTLSTTVAR